MALWYVTPPWFAGYDAALEIIFAVAALLLALFAIRLYKVTSQRSAKLLGSGFALISISYFIQAAFNFVAFGEATEAAAIFTEFQKALALQFIGAFLHVILMLAGLIVLLYMSFNVKNKKLLLALLAIGILPLFLDTNMFATFYALSAICLVFIAWYFLKNYSEKRKTLNLLTATAFLLMLFGHGIFFFAINEQFFYVAGHILELGAYVLLLINFYMVLKK